MVVLILIVAGLALGSFVNALVWRLHEQFEESEKKPTASRKRYLRELSIMTGRSMCPDCHHQLGALDLIPVFSWLSVKGRCRYCQKPISWQYPVVELLMVGLFLISYYYWPAGFHGLGLFEFGIWLICLIGFMALIIYDLRWYLLPNKIVYPLLGLVVGQAFIVRLVFSGSNQLLLSSFWGLVIGGGIFYLLFQLSRGQWIGGGDVKLGAVLGIIVGGPLLACLVLFGASLLGTLFSLPLMLLGKLKRTTHVPFGPFLILATILIRLFGASMTHYLRQRGYLPPL